MFAGSTADVRPSGIPERIGAMGKVTNQICCPGHTEPTMWPATAYTRASRVRAIFTLAMLFVSIWWCITKVPGMTPVRLADLENELDDSALYRAVTLRVRLGEGYYRAAYYELTTRGYAVQSVFNWRFPTYAWLFSLFPSMSWGRVILICLSAMGLTLACRQVGPAEGWPTRIAVGFWLASTWGWVFSPQRVYFTELWCGVLIFISSCIAARGAYFSALAPASAALVLRELALPFCALATTMCLARRKYREFSAWVIMLSCYALLFQAHYRSVRDLVPDIGPPHGSGWLAQGGTAFVLSTCRMAYFLMLLPPWCTAVYLPLAVLGLVGWKSSMPVIKISVIIYMVIFIFAGKSVNYYWGWVYTPMLALGVARAPESVKDLILASSARGRRAGERPATPAGKTPRISGDF